MKLATIEKILSIKPIDQADQIELAQVLGWDVVVRKDKFAPGDWCVYIPIDTIVNPKIKGFETYTNPRIKTKSIRGVWSQGLVVSIGSLDDTIQEQINANLLEGTDVGELLGITKYEKASVGESVFTQTSSPFPGHIISRTDEDNLKSKPRCLEELDGKKIYLTKKMDGMSLTIIYGSDGTVTVCSRNLIITDPTNLMYKYVVDTGLDRLGLKSIAIQGEFCGPKINGNKLNLKTFEFYIFNIKDLETAHYYGSDRLLEFIQTHRLQMVPVLTQFECDKLIHTIQWFQDFANSTTYPGNKPGEGIVIRPCEPAYSSTLGKNLSCKVINQLYKD